MSDTEPRTCPTCGNYNPAIPRDDLPEGARYCTPLSCDAWTVTARLTKQGQKPLRADGRADLAPARASQGRSPQSAQPKAGGG